MKRKFRLHGQEVAAQSLQNQNEEDEDSPVEEEEKPVVTRRPTISKDKKRKTGAYNTWSHSENKDEEGPVEPETRDDDYVRQVHNAQRHGALPNVDVSQQLANLGMDATVSGGAFGRYAGGWGAPPQTNSFAWPSFGEESGGLLGGAMGLMGQNPFQPDMPRKPRHRPSESRDIQMKSEFGEQIKSEFGMGFDQNTSANAHNVQGGFWSQSKQAFNNQIFETPQQGFNNQPSFGVSGVRGGFLDSRDCEVVRLDGSGEVGFIPPQAGGVQLGEYEDNEDAPPMLETAGGLRLERSGFTPTQQRQPRNYSPSFAFTGFSPGGSPNSRNMNAFEVDISPGHDGFFRTSPSGFFNDGHFDFPSI